MNWNYCAYFEFENRIMTYVGIEIIFQQIFHKFYKTKTIEEKLHSNCITSDFSMHLPAFKSLKNHFQTSTLFSKFLLSFQSK